MKMKSVQTLPLPAYLIFILPLNLAVWRPQLSVTTSHSNTLKLTFSVETQKICGVSSGLVGDCRFG